MRLSVGIEDPRDIIVCLHWALWHEEKIGPEEVSAWQDARQRDPGTKKSV